MSYYGIGALPFCYSYMDCLHSQIECSYLGWKNGKRKLNQHHYYVFFFLSQCYDDDNVKKNLWYKLLFASISFSNFFTSLEMGYRCLKRLKLSSFITTLGVHIRYT